VSLVSAGTEMLVYRGQVGPDEETGLETCEGGFGFPIKYGYQVVGEVVAAGEGVRFPTGAVVFARHPHQDLFTMNDDPHLLFGVPDPVPAERAVFANLLDVAVNCLLDVPVRFGDCVVVHGQGTVGSLCGQLARRTAGTVIVVDPVDRRREAALAWGADAAVDVADLAEAVDDLSAGRGADVSIEASGSPAALRSALATTGQEGTIAVVSYFGSREVTLRLSPEFHYRRQRVVSSQVAALGSGLQPRWTTSRRMDAVFALLAEPWLRTPISHTLDFRDAPAAYELIDRAAEPMTGVLLVYDARRISTTAAESSSPRPPESAAR